jgi:nitrate/TMAO reductase-like tetraheme cytochrome c subunit
MPSLIRQHSALVRLGLFAIWAGLVATIMLTASGCYTTPESKKPDALAASTADNPVDTNKQAAANKAHAQVMSKTQYPSAKTCAGCHPKHYSQWSVSQHAYAQMSPIFNAMHGKILKLTNGTNGDFCIRCHTPVGMNLKEPVFMSNVDRHPTSREGITCIVCHRVNKAYGKLSGRLSIVKGDLTEPIFGPIGNNDNLRKAIQDASLGTKSEERGMKVHAKLKALPQLGTSGFCGICHDVNLVNGFRLEEAFSEYKNSPAAKQGISCQDCHMGKEPGKVLAAKNDPNFVHKNYDWGPAAIVGKIKFKSRKLTNHMFAGPDYSVLAPELFPLHPRAIREESEKKSVTSTSHATIRQWIAFRKYLQKHPKHNDTWGNEEGVVVDEMVDQIDDDDPEVKKLPIPFRNYEDRVDARKIVQDNLKLLKFMERERLKVMRNGYHLGKIETEHASAEGIRFRVEVKNATNGHNVPTGFDAERLVWLDVRVYDADNKLIHQSGDLDPNGDLRDLHSLYVHNHELPLDDQLFTLQSRFLVRLLRGGEQEQVLAVPTSLTPLVFLRPERRPTILTGRPGGARKHKKGIEPNGKRWAKYTVKASQLTGKGPYRATIELKVAMIPVNLINEIRDVGFDYDMSARDVAERLAFGHVIRMRDKKGNETLKRAIWRQPAAGNESDPALLAVVGGVYLHQDRIIEIQRLETGTGEVVKSLNVAALSKKAKDNDAEAKATLKDAFAEIWHLSERIGNVPLAELKMAPEKKVEVYLALPEANQVIGHQVLWKRTLTFDVNGK